MAPSFMLLGPPDLPAFPENQKPSVTGDPFMDLMLSDFNNAEITAPPPPAIPINPIRGFTENWSATFLASGNPCLDFFFHILPDTPRETLIRRLELAWNHNPLTTLKLVCHLRGVRNTGKTDKQGFYTAALWLHKNHPKTLAGNVKHMAEFGYFKDLPEILYRLLEGGPRKDTRPPRRGHKYVWLTNKKGRKYYRKVGEIPFAKRGGRRRPFKRTKEQSTRVKSTLLKYKKMEVERKKQQVQNLKATRERTRENRIEAENKKVEIAMEKARNTRKEKKINMAKKAVERYARDPDYGFLHDSVSEVFAEKLVSDLKYLKSGEVGKVSLASKWCPSLDSSFDKATLLCEGIARRVFPRDLYPEYDGVEEAHYAYRVRDRLRKEVLVPLRRVLELPELYMSSNQWNSLHYDRVASVAMTKYKKHFLKHDEERFTEYLDKVKRGEAKIAAGALLPHDIIKEALENDGDSGQVAELQWRRMVEDLLEKGKLRNCLAICDVSGSMCGTPMDVCVALGLLISELSEDPWKGKVMTFSEHPELHKIEGDNLEKKTEFVRNMDWGCNTDFQKVFDRILEGAVNGKLSKEQMIKKLFVFSDMEFDQASCNHTWDTDYEVIESKFAYNGYEVPQIVFWNLRDSKATPVTADQNGVSLVSGYSKNMVTLFLDEDEDLLIPGPQHMMDMAISGPEYSKLIVLD